MDTEEEKEVPAQEQETVATRPISKIVQFPQEFDWKLEEFNEENAIRNFSKLAEEGHNVAAPDERIYIAESAVKGSGITKTNVYIIRGEDPNHGKIEVVRRYSDFYELREALLRRWPAIFIPPVPEKGHIGNNDKQIAKNRLQILRNFLRRVVCREALLNGEEFQVFLASQEADVAKNLEKLKAHSLEELLTVYKATWPEAFAEVSEATIEELQTKINRFETYFTEAKVDLVRQKDEMKRLGELRAKLNHQRYQIMLKTLPEYERLCLNWFNGIQAPKQAKPEGTDSRASIEGGEVAGRESEEGRIYSSAKYQDLLEAYREDVFEEQSEEGWLMYELFKFEIREIDAILQTVSHYKYLASDKKYYLRNVENNKQQLEDINNRRMSFKIFFLSGSEDDKKAQLANETMELENKLRIAEEVWNGATQLLVAQIEQFQTDRCEHYKKNLVHSFKREALLLSKLFNLYVEAQKL